MATIPDPAHQQVTSYTVLVNSLAQVDMQSDHAWSTIFLPQVQ